MRKPKSTLRRDLERFHNDPTPSPIEAGNRRASRALRGLKPIPKIEDATPILPWVIADSVIAEVERVLRVDVRATANEALCNRAQVWFEHDEKFRRHTLRNATWGRDTLYVFMRHWLSAFLKEVQPEVFAWIPDEFCVGHPLTAPRSQRRS